VNIVYFKLCLGISCPADHRHGPWQWLRPALHRLADGDPTAVPPPPLAHFLIPGRQSTSVKFRLHTIWLVLDGRDAVIELGVQRRWLLYLQYLGAQVGAAARYSTRCVTLVLSNSPKLSSHLTLVSLVCCTSGPRYDNAYLAFWTGSDGSKLVGDRSSGDSLG
jgi:hypothetical protein